MNDYLIRYKDRWYIVRPGVALGPNKEQNDHTLQLAWVARDTGTVICFAGDEDRVKTLD